MDIRFKISDAETLAQLHGLSIDAFVEAWAEAVRGLARKNAIEKIGGNFGRDVVAESVRQDTHGLISEVYSKGKIGEHVHSGGPIQSSNGKMLAIPTKWNNRRDIFASAWEKDALILLKSKKRNRAYLFKTPAKGEKLGRPMFFLTPKTKPQKPRPWWPDEMAVQSETIRFFNENF